MPSLSADTIDFLEEPTLPELQLALRNAKLGKALGPEGFIIPYYKTLFLSLGHHQVKLFNDLSTGTKLHGSTLQAQILVIPKEGKDPGQCGSYRSISLLNTDLKLLTKIIAFRLQHHLPYLIHLDQVGLAPTREARDNTKVLNLLHIANSDKTPCVFLGNGRRESA